MSSRTVMCVRKWCGSAMMHLQMSRCTCCDVLQMPQGQVHVPYSSHTKHLYTTLSLNWYHVGIRQQNLAVGTRHPETGTVTEIGVQTGHEILMSCVAGTCKSLLGTIVQAGDMVTGIGIGQEAWTGLLCSHGGGMHALAAPGQQTILIVVSSLFVPAGCLASGRGSEENDRVGGLQLVRARVTL